MLQSISDRAQGWLTWIVFSLLIVPFALWGINHYFEGQQELPVASVNGEEIDSKDFQRVFKQHQQRLQQMMGGVDLNKLDQGMFKQQALNQLIDTMLIHQAGTASGMRVADSQVMQAVNSFEAFMKDGKFSNELYERQLVSAGFTPTTFEEQMRRDILNEQVHDGLAKSQFATQTESDRVSKLRNQKRDLVYFTIKADDARKEAKVTDQDVEKYFNDNKERYMTPEKVKVAYIDLSLEELAKQVNVDANEIRAFYDSHIANYSTEEQRSASHVLVQLAKDADQKAIDAAKQKAEDYAKQVRAGTAFETIAKEHSDDAGSKTDGGQLGFFGRGAMDPAFEQAAFAMKPGDISDPVRSSFGFHVIRLNEIKAGSTKSFDEVKAEVEAAYRKEQAEKLYYDQAERLANLAFEHPDSLEAASKELGLAIRETSLFTRTGGEADLTKNSKFLEVAFSPQVLEENANSEPVEISDNRTVVMHLQERQVAEQRKVDDVRKEIADNLILERARATVADRGAKLLARLRGGEDRTKLAEQEKLTWDSASNVDQRAANVNSAVLKTAFTLGRPEESKSLYGGVTIPGTGDYGVVGVLAVRDEDPAKIEDKVKTQTKDTIQRSFANGDWRDFIAQLRDRAEIEKYNERL